MSRPRTKFCASILNMRMHGTWEGTLRNTDMLLVFGIDSNVGMDSKNKC